VLESYLSAGLNARESYKLVSSQRSVTRLANGLYAQRERDLSKMSGKWYEMQDGLNTPKEKQKRYRMDMTTTLGDVPPVLLVDISYDKLVFSKGLVFPCQGAIATLRLRGINCCIIYTGQGHFTCRFIDKAGKMWFHDGITTGNNCLPEISLHRVVDQLSLYKCREKNRSTAHTI
jgi:hypothetical protein